MKQTLITESEENKIREMYGFTNFEKPKDRLEGLNRSVITSMKDMIYHLGSRKFYDKLNELLGFDVMSKYGPKTALYDIMEKFNFIMTRDENGDIFLKKLPKHTEE
jgi:hypothetical protein